MNESEWTCTDLALAREVLQYLMMRPQARDSTEAIATWWIRRQRLEVAVAAVQRVMERLTEDSLVVEHKNPPGYSINAQRLDEVNDFIQ